MIKRKSKLEEAHGRNTKKYISFFSTDAFGKHSWLTDR